MKRLILAALALATISVPAQAQWCGTRTRSSDQPTRRIDITGTLIPGMVDKPTVTFVQAPPNAKFPSMIKYRANFNPELQDSAARL